jgi:hypothetical protein
MAVVKSPFWPTAWPTVSKRRLEVELASRPNPALSADIGRQLSGNRLQEARPQDRVHEDRGRRPKPLTTLKAGPPSRLYNA